METWDILDEYGKLTGETMNKGNKRVWEEGIYHPGADVWIINSEVVLQEEEVSEVRYAS